MFSAGPAQAMRYMRKLPGGGALSLVHLHVLTASRRRVRSRCAARRRTRCVCQASPTGIIDRMEQRGLVERRRDADDRRVVLVDATDGGRRLFGRDRRASAASTSPTPRRADRRRARGLPRRARALRAAAPRTARADGRSATAAPPPGGPGGAGMIAPLPPLPARPYRRQIVARPGPAAGPGDRATCTCRRSTPTSSTTASPRATPTTSSASAR